MVSTWRDKFVKWNCGVAEAEAQAEAFAMRDDVYRSLLMYGYRSGTGKAPKPFQFTKPTRANL
jgi:hypothetical protein